MNQSPRFYFTSIPTALGRFSLAVDGDGAVAAAVFGGRAALERRLRTSSLSTDPRRTAAARRQVLDWFRARRRRFTLALAPAGTAFQRRVWAALGRIPRGETRSYGALARALGSSARAVGRANATNPICLIVPCHRVIGSDGSLTGYAYGGARKGRLLALEGAAVSGAPPRAPRPRTP
jgi:methylated-DNA-[protein]-cysteine S-methyltransferase